METTEKRQGKDQIFLTTIDKHSNTNDNTPQFTHSTYRLSERASCGQDVINHKDVLTTCNFKIAPEDSYFSFFFSKDAPHS